MLTNALLFTGVSSAVVAGLFWGMLSLVHETGRFGDTSDLLLLVAGAIVSALTGASNAFLTGCGRWRAQSLLSAAAPWFYAALLAATWAGTILSVQRALVIWVVLYGAWALAPVRGGGEASPAPTGPTRPCSRTRFSSGSAPGSAA